MRAATDRVLPIGFGALIEDAYAVGHRPWITVFEHESQLVAYFLARSLDGRMVALRASQTKVSKKGRLGWRKSKQWGKYGRPAGGEAWCVLTGEQGFFEFLADREMPTDTLLKDHILANLIESANGLPYIQPLACPCGKRMFRSDVDALQAAANTSIRNYRNEGVWVRGSVYSTCPSSEGGWHVTQQTPQGLTEETWRSIRPRTLVRE